MEDTITVIVDAIVPDPIVQIDVPFDGATVTSPIEIIGTATMHSLTSWTLSYAAKDGSVSDVIATSSTSVTDNVLGTFDPTLMLNGQYTITLEAHNSYGLTETDEIDVVVDGGMKVGNFTVSFMDLSIPVSGIPIQITRTYDSRNKESNDFGTGWTLDIRNVKLQESTIMGEGWKSVRTTSGFFWTNYWVKPTRPHIVTVTTTDGQMHTFDFTLGKEYWQLYPPTVVFPKFEPRPGTTCTLEQKNPQEVIVHGSFSNQWQTASLKAGLGIFDPSNYILTLKNGTQLEISDIDGLDILRDRNENTLQITENGIIHSSGKSVDFTRDTDGRITMITDPMGNSIDYTYDVNDDLISVTDQEDYTTSFAYNSDHYLTEITDPRGITPARQLYDDDGRMIAMVDAVGDTIHLNHDISNNREVVVDRLNSISLYEYDNRGNVTSFTDANGNTSTFTYDDVGNLLSKTDPFGNSWTYEYDPQGNKTRRSDPLGNDSLYTYNQFSQELTITDPENNVIINTYDFDGNLLTQTDPHGNTVTNTYDASGQITAMTDGTGRTLQFEYNTDGRLTKKIDPYGNEVDYTYDINGNQLSQTTVRTTPSGTETLTVSKTYDDLNRVIQITNAEGATIDTVFNDIGKAESITDRNGNTNQYFYTDKGDTSRIVYADTTEEIYTYDLEGRKLSSTDRGSRVTTYEYDNVGNLIHTTCPDASFITNEYDEANRLIKKTDQRGNKTLYTFDEAGRNITVTDALGNVTTYAYDGNNNKTSMSDALDHVTLFDYDAYGRIIKTTMHDGTFTETKYDILGRKESYRDQGGIVTRYTHNLMGQLVAVADTLNQITQYKYDEVGNRVKMIDANGHETLMEYDNMGRMIKKTLPLGMSESWTWDGNGNMFSHTDYNDNAISYEYDSNDRLVKKMLPDLTEEVYTYTASGQRESVTDARGITTYSYDAMDRLLQRTDPDGKFIAYTYDNAGNRTELITPDDTTIYTFDGLNRTQTVTSPDSGLTVYTYDNAGNLESTTYDNGTVAAYSYNDLNRLTQVLNTKANGDTISCYTYILGPTGNRTSVTEHNNRQVNYTFDKTYRLVEEQIDDPDFGIRIITYEYDFVGNRMMKVDNGDSTSYVYDDNNRLITENKELSTVTYKYDNNGNTTSKTSLTEDVTYSYDYQNRMIQADVNGLIITYAYDTDGMRVQKTIGTEGSHYLLDNNREFAQVIQEHNGSGSLIVSYVHGLDLISQNRSGFTNYFHYDGQHSTHALTDDIAQITDTYNYDAFGLLLQRSGSTLNDYLYTGEQFDPNVGFYYLRARYYNPEIGRFTTVDPWKGSIYDPVSLHKYLYCNNDPVDFVDWSGENYTKTDLVIAITISGILARACMATFKIAFIERPQEVPTWNDLKEIGIEALKGLFQGITIGLVLVFGITAVTSLIMYTILAALMLVFIEYFIDKWLK